MVAWRAKAAGFRCRLLLYSERRVSVVDVGLTADNDLLEHSAVSLVSQQEVQLLSLIFHLPGVLK